MAITLLVGVVPLTVESGQTVFLTPSSQIQVVVDGVVIDPSTITVNVTPPDATLTLPDGQVVTLAGFVDETGQAGGGLVDADGELVVASTLEGLTQAAAGPAPTPAPSPEALEPGAGGQAGGPGGVDAGGSSIAVVTYFEDGFGNIFGISPSGEFVSLALPPLDVVPFEELPLLLEDEILALVAEAIVGEFLLFTDSLVPGFEGLTNPTSPDDFAFFNNPSAPLFSGGTLNLAFDDVSGSSGVPFDLNITNSMNGNDTVELADAGNPNGNNLKELFGVPTAFYGGTGDDTLTGGTDHDIIVGDGQQAGNSVMDCGDEKKDKSEDGKDHKHHLESVVIKGDDDTIDGGDGDDVLLGDGLVSTPGFDLTQRNIGFPNLVDPAGPPGGPIDPSMEMPANLKLNFLIGMFGPDGVKANVLDVEVEKQAKITLKGGEDTLIGGEGDDLAIGDALVIVEGRGGRHHDRDDKDDIEIEEQGIGNGDHHRAARPDVVAKGGDDALEGNDGDDKLIGDGIFRKPAALIADPHGGGLQDLSHGVRKSAARLEGGDDTLEGNDGSDKLIGDGILNISSKFGGGKGLPPAKVAVFDDERFVESDGGNSFHSSSEVQASLDHLGHKIRTFSGISAEEIAKALEGKDVLLIPELARVNPNPGENNLVLSEEALDVIREFVRGGGRLIIHGTKFDSFNNAGELLNQLFGYDVDEEPANGTNRITGEEEGTIFEGGPKDIPVNTPSRALTNLPDGAKSIYEDEDGESAVALFEEGHGQVIYLGWTFSNSFPSPGSSDGGWLNVLDLAVSPEPPGIYGGNDTLIGGDDQDMMSGDGLVNIAVDGRGRQMTQVSGGEGGGHKKGGIVIEGGDDLMFGDSVDGKDGQTVAVFDNPDFVRTSENSGSQESHEIQETLADLGHEVMTFTGITAAEISAALAGKDVLVFPENNGSLPGYAGAFSEEALDVIRDFVRGGGKLVIHGNTAGKSAAFLNEIFGYGLSESFTEGSDPSALTGNEGGTPFESGPSEINENGATSGITGLPSNGTSIYEAVGGETTVAFFTEGSGQVTYLGWDWFLAAPEPGERDGGWLEVMDRAVRSDSNDDIMLGDGILNASLSSKFGGGEFAGEFGDSDQVDSVQVSGGEGGDRRGGKSVLAGGDDTMLGGLGDDKMVGDAILNAHAAGLLALGHEGHGPDFWAGQEFWFDKELLFGDLTRKDKGKYGKGKPGDSKPSDAKLFGGDDFMFGGQGNDWMRGDGLWEIADERYGRSYGHGDRDESALRLEVADKAKGGHDVMFGGADEDKMWGEGGHDFIVGDGFTTGLDQGLRDLGEDLVASLSSGEGGGLIPPELLADLLNIGAILDGFEDVEGGILQGDDDTLFGGNDDRGTFGKSVGDVGTAGENGGGRHDDLPIWAREFGIDDIILGDGLIGFTHDFGAFVPLLEELLASAPELEELIALLLPGVDVEEVLDFLAADVPLFDFSAAGGDDYMEGNSGRDLLAGDFITWLNIAPTGVFKAPPSPSPEPQFAPATEEEGYAVTAFMLGGDDVMYGDSPNDRDDGGKKKAASSDDFIEESGSEGWAGLNGDREVSYDDLMFGDLLLGIDVGSLLGDLVVMPEAIAPALDGAGLLLEAEGGDDRMIGGRGSDVIHGDGILLGAGFLLDDFDIIELDNPLAAISAFSNISTAQVEGAASVIATGGNDMIWGDSDHGKNRLGGDGKAITSGDDWGDSSFNDDIFGDGILAAGGSQTLTGGDDQIWAGKGDDVVLGDGIGSDETFSVEIIGGNDLIDGGEGNDLIYGDALLDDEFQDIDSFDNDFNPLDAASFAAGRIQGDTDAESVLFGGEASPYKGGDDTLQGGEGNDTVYGEGGNDTVDGGRDIDIVFGGVGSDLGIWADPWAEAGTNSGGIFLPDTGDDDLIGARVGEKDYYDGNFGNFDENDGFDVEDNRTSGRDDPADPVIGSAQNQIDFDTLLFALSEEQLGNSALLDELLAYQTRLAGGEGGKDDTNEFEFDEIPLVAVEWEGVDFALFWCEDHVAQDIRFGDGSSNKIIGGKAVLSTSEMIDAETAFNNMILGQDGGDTLIGDSGGQPMGDDILLGQSGNDTLLGDRDAPLIEEQGGDDKLIGGEDSDTLVGDTGATLIANRGNISGGEGGEGQGGNDKLFGDNFDPGQGGEQGNDLLFGDAFGQITDGGRGGDDLLVGGGNSGVEQLMGDAGTAMIGGSGGNDTLIGDYLIESKDGKDKGKDLELGDLPFPGDDRMFGDSRLDMAPGEGDEGSDVVGGHDTLVGDTKLKLSKHDLDDDGIPSLPDAGKDFLVGDAGGKVGTSSSSAQEAAAFGGNDDLTGDYSIEIDLGDGGHGYGHKGNGIEGDLAELLAHADHDTISGDAGSDLVATRAGDASPFTVALALGMLDSNGNPDFRDGVEVQDALEFLGYTVNTFSSPVGGPGEGLSAADFTAALANADVLVIPEKQFGNPLADEPEFDAAAQAVVREFVENGGKLIIHGDDGGVDSHARVLNALFGFSLQEGFTQSLPPDFNQISNITGDAAGTIYAGLPETIVRSGAGFVDGLVTSSLPSNATSIYEGVANDGSTTLSHVVLFEDVGAGSVVYVGYNFQNSFPPPGEQDGGWLEILNRSVHMGEDVSAESRSFLAEGGDDHLVGDTALKIKGFSSGKHVGGSPDISVGEDLLFGDAGRDVILAKGGDDEIIGDNEIDIELAETHGYGNKGGATIGKLADLLHSGDDTISGDAGNNLVGTEPGEEPSGGIVADVALFVDPGFVFGADGTTPQFNLAEELRTVLEDSLGHNVETFQGLTGTDFTQALDGKKALVIPGQKTRAGFFDDALGDNLEPAAIQAIIDFLAGGGNLILTDGQTTGLNADFLGDVFGLTSLLETGLSDPFVGTLLPGTAGTIFEPGVAPATIPYFPTVSTGGDTFPGVNSLFGPSITGLPITPFYTGNSNSFSDHAVVASIDTGSATQFGGQVIYFGWDWLNSLPAPGEDDPEGWNTLLDLAVTMGQGGAGDSGSSFLSLGGNDYLVGDTKLTISGSSDEAYKSWSNWIGGSSSVDLPRLGDDTIAGDALNSMTFSQGGNDVIYGDYHIELENLGKLEHDIKHQIEALLRELEIPPQGYEKAKGHPSLESLLDKLLDQLGGDDFLVGDAGGLDEEGAGDMTGSAGGNDTIFGQGGKDIIYGDASGTAISSTGGDDIIYGGGGGDRISGDVNKTLGGEKDSVLGDDKIFGGKGEDFIAGDALDSIAFTDAGNDTIEGGYGDDFIFGDASGGFGASQGGRDSLFGGAGDDRIYGGAGSTINGNASDESDLIDGGKGNDLLVGDTLGLAGLGAELGGDSIKGGRGNDILYGDAAGQNFGNGPATQRGDAFEVDGSDPVGGVGVGGDDVLDGGSGSDTVFGGGGNDIGIWRGVENIEGEPDLYDGGGGTANDISDPESEFDEGADGGEVVDTLHLILSNQQFGSQAVWDEIIAFNTHISSTGATVGDDVIFTFNTLGGLRVIEWEEVRVSLEGCDDLLIDPGTVTIGDDNLSDDIVGDRGILDVIFGLGGDDTLTGDALGDDDLGDDVLFGGADADLLLGDANARLEGDGVVGGNDKLFGGDGDDHLVGDTGPIPASGFGDLQSGAKGGNDLLFGGAGDDILSGDSDDDVDTDSAAPEDGAGTGGDDTISGGAGDDQAFGDARDEVEDGGKGGNDLIVGDEIEEIHIDASEIFDELFDIDTSVIVTRSSGNDLLSGDAGLSLQGGGSVGGRDRMVGDNLLTGTVSLTAALLTDTLVTEVSQRGDDSMFGDAVENIGDGSGEVPRPGAGGDDWMVGDDAVDLELDIDVAIDFDLDFAAAGLDGYSLNGNDTMSGDAGESLFASSNGGNDTLIGDNSLALSGAIKLGLGKVVLFDDTADIGQTNETESPNGGDDVIFGDAADAIVQSDGGDDTIVGDNALDLALDLTISSDGLLTTSNLGGGKGFADLARFLHSGDDSLFGDSGNTIRAGGVTIAGDEGIGLDASGGDDTVIGDNKLDVDLNVCFHGDFEFPDIDPPFSGANANGDGGFLKGGDDVIVGDAGGFDRIFDGI